MTSPIRIGSGSIILVPDARAFRAQANTELKKIELYKDVLVQPRLETGFKKNAQARLDKVRLTATAHVQAKLADGFREDARTKAQAALAGIGGTITARLQIDTATATARMEAWRSRQQRPLRIRVMTIHEDGTPTGGRGGGGNLGASLLNGTIDPAEVAKALQKLNREISRGGGAQLPVTPRLNNNSSQQLQRDMDRMANSLRLNPSVGGLSLRAPLGGAFGLTALPEMITQVGALTAAIQELGQAGLILPGIFAAAGASFATVLVGVSGLKEAYKALDTVQKDSATTGASEESARREMRNALQDEVRARRDLSDAIANEQRKQRDMALQLRGGKLAEAGAILELQESAEKLRTGRFTNRLEYDKGVLEYEQNYQNLLEVRNHNADLAQDVAKNERTGVQNSDPVLNASEALTKATERMSDASQKLAEGSSALGTASAKAQAALDKLSPSAQDFIKNLIAMRPEFHRFAQGVQEDLMSGLTPAFNNLFHSPAIQTNMRTGMQGLASAMNAQIKTVMGDLGTPQMGGMFSRIFGSTTDSANRFNQSGLTPMIDGLARLGAVGAEELPRVSDALGMITTRFNNFVTKADADGSLKRWMDQGLDAFTQVGRILANIESAMSGVNRAFGGSFLKDVDDVTKRIADFLNSGRGQDDLERLIVNTKAAMAEWRPILSDLIPVLKEAFDTGRTYVSNMLGPLDLLLKAFDHMPWLISGIVTAFASWKTITAVLSPINGAVQGLQGAFGNLANNLDGVGGKMGGVGKFAGELSTKLGTFASAIGIGGPIVAAITTGIMVALEMWNGKQKEVEQETQQLIQQQNEFANSLDRTSGMITQQSRDDISKRLSDYKPTHKGSLSGNALDEAQKIGVSGSDLVTAALPGGTSQYNNIMGKVRDKVRPLIASDAGLMELAKSKGLSEDDVINAFLGVPSALAKYNDAMKNLSNDQKGIADLHAVQGLAQSAGGDVLSAAVVGQALSGTASTGKGGAPGSPADLARRAANPDVGLPDNSIFGKGMASAGNGEYKVVTTVPPTDPNIAMLIKAGGAKVQATVPGAVGPDGKPFSGFEYTFASRDMAKKYLTNVPDYHTGGETKGGLGNLLDDEFVIKDRGRFPAGMLDAINEGRINPDDLPHLLPGGPVPIDIPPPVPVPPPTPPPVAPPTPGVPDMPAGGDHLPGQGPALPGPATQGGVTGAISLPVGAQVPNSGGIDLSGTPTAPAAGTVAPIPPGGFNSLIFGAQGAPTGGFGNGQGIGQGILQSFLGGGGSGGGQSIGGMFEQIAGKFGQIAMQGLLGFFGINPQYMGDLAKLIPGLSKVFGGGFSDPSAQAQAEGDITAYAADGTPISYSAAPGTPGTALPDANSTGTGGGASPPSTTSTITPGGLSVAANPASQASSISGAPNVEANIAAAQGRFSPIYKPGLNTGGYGGATDGLPQWAVQLGSQFGLTPSTYANGGSLHQMGYAFDFTPTKDNPDPTGSMNRFSQFITDNLGSQTLQLIHSDPGANGGRGQNWGIAAGKRAESISPGYYMGGGGYGDHRDHVHWATDVPVLMGQPGSAAVGAAAAPADPNNPLVGSIGGSTPSTTPLPPSTTNATAPSGGGSLGQNTSPGPQVNNPATPLPNTIQSNNNGPLPPAVISPPSSTGDSNLSGPGGGDDATQVLALTAKHGALVVESAGVAKANGDTILGPAPKDGTTPNWGNVLGNGNGAKPGQTRIAAGQAPPEYGGPAAPPPGTNDAGLDINIPDTGPFVGGGGGRALPARIMRTTQGVAARPNITTPDQLKAFLAGSPNANTIDIKQRARALYAQAGLPIGEWDSFDQLISHESSWSPTAQNPGSTAHGLGQFLDTTWATVGAAKTDDADAQLKAVFAYLKQRPDYHGSPAAAWNLWQQRHWYAAGGHITEGAGGRDDVLAMLARNEFVHRDKSVNMYGLDFHHALNQGMIDPRAVDALMNGGMPRFLAGGTLGAPPPPPNDLQAIQAQLGNVSNIQPMSSASPTPPADPSRSGVSLNIPNIAHMVPPHVDTPPTTPTAAMPMAPPQPGGPTTPPPPAPLTPEAGVPVQPDIAPAPASTDHELPALKQGVTSAATVLGNMAAMAAGASGFGGPAAGLAAGLVQQGGKIVNGMINVVSSALVGTLTPGTTANPYGQQIRGNAAPQTLMPMDNSTHYHGDLYANDMDDFMRRQDIRDSVNLQSQLAATPGA